ncbi:MAG: hypothetical protein NVS9B1_15600 [Candidatus Dormibacteraceae bacterium]
MKALSIRHPWVDLLLAGRASVLIRARPTAHRGELLLHASGAYGRAEREATSELGLPPPGRAALGALVGRAMLTGCRLADDAEWEQAAMPPRSGRLWAWRLEEVRALPAPVALKGRRTLFDVDPEVLPRKSPQPGGGTAA